MQTHMDSDQAPAWLDQLRTRAGIVQAMGQSQITAGKPGEEALATWKANGVSIRHMPPDEQGILRISIGGGDDLPVPLNYLVFRGEHAKCINLLRAALKALEQGPE